MKKLSSLGEFNLIKSIQKNIVLPRSVVKGIGDDTAVVELSKDKYSLLTTDMLIENTHFKKAMSPYDIGYKAMACNVSDIAAMGGLPKHALVSIGLPASLSVDYVEMIYKGMMAVGKKFGVTIVGGDTVRSEKIVINVTLTGEVLKKKLVMRSGAKVGDQIFVTGALGGSFESGWHLSFTPRIKESQYFVNNFHPTAMIDISDGLVSDLGHILEESNKGAMIYEITIPRNDDVTLSEALNDGEDFELLFTLPAKEAFQLMKSIPDGMHFYPIGVITDNKTKLTLVDYRGKKKVVTPGGFKHF